MWWLYLLAWLVLSTLIYLLTQKHWRREGFFLLLFTKKGTKFIQHFGRKHSKFFKWFGNISIVVGIICAIFMVYLLILNLQIYFEQPQIAGPAVKIILPIETNSPYVLSIHWYVFVISLVLLLIFHELAHAFVAAAQKIKVRELGLAFIGLGPIPIGPIGAFTAPDEKQVEKTTILNRMRIFAAGPGANILFIGLFFFVFLTLFAAEFNIGPQGVVVSNLSYCGTYEHQGTGQQANAPCNPTLSHLNLTRPIIISGIYYNDKAYNFSDFVGLHKVLSKFEPRQNATLLTSAGEYNFSFIKNPVTNETNIGIVSPLLSDKNFLAINVVNFFNLHLGLPILKYGYYAPTIENKFFFLLCWVFVINLFVGLFNLLPLKPLDGGYLYEDFLNLFIKNANLARNLKLFGYLFVFLLLLANIFNQQFLSIFFFIHNLL